MESIDNGNSSFTITPELQIGTEFWIMYRDKPLMGLVASYKVYVTSAVDSQAGWKEQLFNRFIRNKHKEVYKMYSIYECKLECELSAFGLEKNKKGVWMIHEREVYFSLEDLKKALD